MKLRRDKKHPNDYPQFAFRLYTKSEKKALEAELERARRAANKGLAKGQKKYSKKEIIMTALKDGFRRIQRNEIKLPE